MKKGQKGVVKGGVEGQNNRRRESNNIILTSEI